MVSIVYAHDGTSVYDELFLKHLTQRNRVYFLTFNKEPRNVGEKAQLVRMREPCAFSELNLLEGLRMYLSFFLRAFILRVHLRRVQPQLVVGCMATKYGFYSALTGFRPLVVIVWGSDVLVTSKRFFFFRFMAKYALKNADAVILDSEIQEKAAVQLGCRPDRVFRFPWFDLGSILPQKSRSEVREQLGWQDNILVFSARGHEPIYGVEYLIEAIPEVVEKEPRSRFLIVGDGQLTESFKQRVRQLGVGKYVKFLGRLPREETITYLNASDINVSASFSDGTSASLLEAMALAVPSVVTNIPGNMEWILDGGNGCLVPIRDSKSLAERILVLARDSESRQELGQEARRTVETRVNWLEHMKALDDLIQKLVMEA